MENTHDPFQALIDCVHTCVASNDKTEIARAVVAAIECALNVDRALPRFFSFTDLEKRWGLQRKAIERLEIPRTKFGGSVRFAAVDVFDFEQLNRSTTERIPS